MTPLFTALTIVLIIVIAAACWYGYRRFLQRPAGASCVYDIECAKGACGRPTAADGAPLVCCPSGQTDTYGGFDYCTGMPNGSVCWSDAMCAGGTCKGNVYGVQRGVCTGNNPVNAPCTENDDCANNACGRTTAAEGAALVCCPSGKTDGYGGFDYCTGMPNGSVCWSDAMCANGICKGNIVGVQRGTCTGNDPVNSTCTEDDDCANHACGRPTAAPDSTLVCCPSGTTDTYGGFDYCTGMPNGATCWSDVMCANGTCKGDDGGVERGNCTGNDPPGSSCTENDDCASHACGRQTAADGSPLICCPSGSIDTYGGYDYCTGMPSGSVCWSDAMCQSGNCKGNFYGAQKGVCS